MAAPSLSVQVEAADSRLYEVPGRFTAGDVRLLRDVAAIVLLLAGLAGLGVAAHHVSPWLLLTYVSVVAVVAGIALGMDRSR